MCIFFGAAVLPCILICCSHINSHNQVRGHRTGSSHSGAEECPRKKTQTNQRWYTHISQLTQFMPPPETYKRVKSGVSPRSARSILAHTSHYLRLAKPTIRLPTQEGLPRIYITRSTYHYAYALLSDTRGTAVVAACELVQQQCIHNLRGDRRGQTTREYLLKLPDAHNALSIVQKV